jgi:hypothetical protein
MLYYENKKFLFFPFLLSSLFMQKPGFHCDWLKVCPYAADCCAGKN